MRYRAWAQRDMTRPWCCCSVDERPSSNPFDRRGTTTAAPAVAAAAAVAPPAALPSPIPPALLRPSLLRPSPRPSPRPRSSVLMRLLPRLLLRLPSLVWLAFWEGRVARYEKMASSFCRLEGKGKWEGQEESGKGVVRQERRTYSTVVVTGVKTR